METPNVANKSDFWLHHQEGHCCMLYVLLRSKLIPLYKKLSISVTLWGAPVIRVYESCFVKILLDCLGLSPHLKVFLCRGQYKHLWNAVIYPCPYKNLNPQSPWSSGRMHTLFWQIAEFRMWFSTYSNHCKWYAKRGGHVIKNYLRLEY